MREIILLECLYGYEFEIREDEILYVHVDGPIPTKQDVLPLFDAVQDRRSEAIKFLTARAQPVDIAGHLWSSADSAQEAAATAEASGDHRRAQLEWGRYIRLLAAAAEASGASDPHVPWPSWIAGHSGHLGPASGDSEK